MGRSSTKFYPSSIINFIPLISKRGPRSLAEIHGGHGGWERTRMGGGVRRALVDLLPMKQNPSYKGKWHAPLIDNPSYKGIWKPQDIPNPEYFELDKPDFNPIAAIGIEIWTMHDDIVYGNILFADD
ncbi:hypothetical protein VPH35_112948 [Triticum aestivum]